MKNISLLLLLLVWIAGCQAKAQKALSPEEFEKELKSDKKAQLVDVRTHEEYAEQHLDKAINMDYYTFSFRKELQKLDKEEPVMVYCRSGRRSAHAAKILRSMGFKKVWDLSGGILQWMEAGKKTIK